MATPKAKKTKPKKRAARANVDTVTTRDGREIRLVDAFFERVALLPTRAILHFAHQALRREGREDEADVIEAVGNWQRIEPKKQNVLVQAARTARTKKPGRGRSTDRGRRAQLVHELSNLPFESLSDFALLAFLLLLDSEALVIANGGKVPDRVDPIVAALEKLGAPKNKSEDPDDAKKRLADGEWRARAVLDSCGIVARDWVRAALDR